MRNCIVIGGSAGSIDPLRTIVKEFSSTIPVAIFVVIHVMANAPSRLPQILARTSNLKVAHAIDGMPVQDGHVYVAPPDRHLEIRNGLISVNRGPRYNSHRPAIDPLFKSAAEAFGDHVIAVLLSGMDGDGSDGLKAVKARGGTAIVQDPNEAIHQVMLRRAIAQLEPSLILPAREIGPKVIEMVRKTKDEIVTNVKVGETDPALADKLPSPFSCPECGGVLWQADDAAPDSYRCRVGHTYSDDALLMEQTLNIEKALWAGLRALEEKESLLRRLAADFRVRGHETTAKRFDDNAKELEEPATTLRNLLNQANLFDLPDQDEPESQEAGKDEPPRGEALTL